MKKLILLLIIGGVLYGGYSFYNSSFGKTTIETTQMAKLGHELVNEEDPATVLSIIEEKEDVVNILLERNYITAEGLEDFKGIVKEFEKNGEPVDKKAMAEKYLKDKATPDQLKDILDIVDKEKISLSDIDNIRKLLQ